jgi:hypothetical protein
MNVNSSYKLQVDQQNRFLRCFISNGIVIQNMKYNLPVIGTDGAH